MDITRCRHTFTEERLFNPWKRCSFCLESIAPFAAVRRCTTCNTVVHAHCYHRIIQQVHRVAAIMEGETLPELYEQAAQTTQLPPPSSPPPATPPPSIRTRTMTNTMNAYNTFADYAAAQKMWLMDTIVASPASSATTTTTAASSNAAKKDADQSGQGTRQAAETGDARWWSAMFASPTSTTPVNAPAPSTGAAHVHSLEPFKVYVPFHKCAVCARRGPAMASSGQRANPNNNNTTHNNDVSVGEEMADMTSAEAAIPTAPQLEVHYDPIQQLLRDGGWLGLGMDGYHCTTCADGFELHGDCLSFLARESYVLKAPPAHRMKGDTDDDTATTTARRAASVDGEKSGSGAALSATEMAAALASKSLPNWVKLLLHAYLTASSTSSGNRSNRTDGDGNVDRILDNIYAYMGLIIDEFPNLGTQLLNPVRMRQLNREHDALYEACCATLEDADIFGRLTASLASPSSPAAPAASPASPTGAAPRTVSLNLQQHPTTLFLRDTMRFAMAVYGECYRNGSLSSLFTATMLFTTNKNDVYNMPKETNDKAVTDVLTLPRTALKLSRWTSHAAEASYALLVDHGSQRIVVAFRGTISEVDILTDICAFGEPFCGGLAHQGAARAVNLLFDYRASRVKAAAAAAAAAAQATSTTDAPAMKKSTSEVLVGLRADAPAAAAEVPISSESHGASTTTAGAAATPPKDMTGAMPAAILHESGFAAPSLLTRDGAEPDALLDMLEDFVLNKFPTYDVVITGHSLGAGEAILFGVRLAYDQILPRDVLASRVHVVAFAPMPTLSLPAAAVCDAVPSDGSTLASPSKLAAAEGAPLACMWSLVDGCDVVPRLQINSLNRLCALLCQTEPEPRTNPNEKAGGGPNSGLSSPEGVPSLADSADQPTSKKKSLDLMPELYHPGRVFTFTHPRDPQRNRLVEVPRGHIVTHEIFVTPTMLSAHLIDNYMEAMRYLRTREMPAPMPNPTKEEDPPAPPQTRASLSTASPEL